MLDASVLINLLHAECLAVLDELPGYGFVVPEDVVAEIVDPRQREEVDRAVTEHRLRIVTISEPDDLAAYGELRRVLGRGEAACIVLAKRHGWLIACDEKGRFQREATTALGAGRVVNTAGLLVMAIRAGAMSVADADHAKDILERHRFKMPFASFSDLNLD